MTASPVATSSLSSTLIQVARPSVSSDQPDLSASSRPEKSFPRQLQYCPQCPASPTSMNDLTLVWNPQWMTWPWIFFSRLGHDAPALTPRARSDFQARRVSIPGGRGDEAGPRTHRIHGRRGLPRSVRISTSVRHPISHVFRGAAHTGSQAPASTTGNSFAAQVGSTGSPPLPGERVGSMPPTTSRRVVPGKRGQGTRNIRPWWWWW